MTDGNITDDRNIAGADSEWDSGIAFSPGNNTYALMGALLTEADRIDSDLEDIYDQHHVNSATGDDLEKIGDLVNVRRQTGESDNRYRARIKGKFRAATTGTTFDQFVEFTASVLSTEISNVEFLTSYGARPATVGVATDSSVYDSLSLSASNLADLLDDGVPAGHRVRVLERGTFRLKQDGDTDDPDKGLTSDGISTGGTLAADLI